MGKENPMDTTKNENQEESNQKENLEPEVNFDEEIAKRKAEIAERNEDVQGSKVLDKRGQEHAYNYNETHAANEARVLEIEKEIHELENKKRIKEIDELKKIIEDAQARLGKLESPTEKSQKREEASEQARKAAAIDSAVEILNEAGLTEQAKKLQETTKEDDDSRWKWVDHYDPTKVENDDEDETEIESTSDKVTPEEWKKAEKETGYERYPDDTEKSTPEQPEPTPEPVPDQPKPEPTPEVLKLPEQCPQIFRKEYETEKTKGSVWGWIKERLKGLGTMGFWEIHQAEKFRTRSKAESSMLQQEAKNIDQIENLDYRAAYEEAARIQEMAKQNRKDSRDDYEKFSNVITAEKMNSNTKEIERIMQESVLRLEKEMEKGRFQGYRTESGKSVINTENMEKYQERLRDQLLSLQSGTKAERGGAVPINEKVLRNIVRGLDENYWRRYVYGGAELLIDAALINYAVGALVGKAAETGATKAAAETFYTMKKGDTLWAISKAELLKAGIPTTNANIMAGAKTLATANNVGVNVWGLAGTPLDTMMPVGYKVSLGALKAAIGAGAI